MDADGKMKKSKWHLFISGSATVTGLATVVGGASVIVGVAIHNITSAAIGSVLFLIGLGMWLLFHCVKLHISPISTK